MCVFGPDNRQGAERRQHAMIGSTPQMLQDNISLTATASDIGLGRIRVSADVRNFGAGHSFPTGIAIRNALLVLTARYNGVDLAQVAGPTIPFWGSDDVPGNQPGDYAGHAGKGFAAMVGWPEAESRRQLAPHHGDCRAGHPPPPRGLK